MLAMHIDYSKEDWENNTVNSETDHHRISAIWVKDSLTANSVPSADIYTKGKNGSNYLNMEKSKIN